MGKVKLTTLARNTIVLVDGYSHINRVEDILEDLEFYKDKEVYTVTPHYASFNAEKIMDSVIENESCNGMYEDWEDVIWNDITPKDLADLQEVFNRILSRNPEANVSYEEDKLIEFDV